MHQSPYSGLHLLANLHGVDADLPAMTRLAECRSLCVEAIQQAGLTMVGECFHGFGDGMGVTGALVLAESHLTIHTWPESGYVTLDVFVCNYRADNSDKALQVFERLIVMLAPQRVERVEVRRG